MQPKLFLTLLLSVWIMSCNLPNKQTLFDQISVDSNGKLDTAGTPQTIKLKSDFPDTPIICKLQDIFDSVDYICLETNENCIVGSISSMEIINDTIYICDSWKSKNVFVFDIKGKFICSIGQLGEGPGEYLEPTSFYVNDNFVYIYDQWQHKALKYSHKGKLLSEKILPFACVHIMQLGNGDMLCQGSGSPNNHLPEILDYGFWQCDSIYSTIKKVGFYQDYKKVEASLSQNYHYHNNINHYFDMIRNTYYSIDDNGKFNPLVKLECIFDVKPHFYSDSHYHRQCIDEGKAFDVIDFVAFDKYAILFSQIYNWNNYSFFNLENNTFIHCSFVDFTKSDISRVLFLNRIYTIHNNLVVYGLYPEDILDSNKRAIAQVDLWKGASPELIARDKALLQSLHEEDNPILVFAKLKEHF